MYLHKVFIENSGPLRNFELHLRFNEDGAPKPLVLVGTNGTGKTNLMSLIADALFEAAAVHYENVLPSHGLGRAWFRVVGGRTTTVGASGGFSILAFQHKDQLLLYKEKAGRVDPVEAAQRIPEPLSKQLNWPTEGSFKEFSVSDEVSRKLFEENVYAYFPSSRSEIPFWLNRKSIPETEFDIFSGLSKKLEKPIYVERSLDKFKQWLLSVILESKSDFDMKNFDIKNNPNLQFVLQGNVRETILSKHTLANCNSILKLIMGDETVRFVWLGRNTSDKLGVARENDVIIPTLDALSGGQSSLLALFGTLLRYADNSMRGPALFLDQIRGICIVDEIDSHMHVDLQYQALPRLMAMFPNIQFIVSSHSPLFVLGMKNTLGEDGFKLVEMPNAKIVTSETYSEFGRAMEALTATTAFNAKLFSETSKPGLPLVFVEGETDPPYLRRAAEVLGREDILSRCEIHWIGAKDESGQGFNTGKGALDHTLAVIRANSNLTSRPILLLYDNDATKESCDYGVISTRVMPSNPGNTKVKVGIENLLSNSSITDSDYDSRESVKPNGDIHTRRSLKKAELCKRICKVGSTTDFAAFSSALDIIQEYLTYAENNEVGVSR